MTDAQDLADILVAAHALTRVAALETRNEAPAAQWRTLGILVSRGPMRIGDLAKQSRVTQPGITRLIGGMAEQGLVEREADPDDTRAVRVALTPRGRRAYFTWREQLAEALLPRFSELDEAQWQTLRSAARILTSRIAPPDEMKEAEQ
ncbi:MAG: MarR family winged helix-turn-helix transcriptional regulator [Candidatus Microbacterium stercoravium]|uniref:MarR family transcriptional regulator n=1 Tax=Candidatus Microbacterium stercoravium TaxID=2838697 RepID=A0A9D2H5E3_9MICO|nr:MarR family transcriptional regulator [Candidatus Microbacterium stercoravium]